MIKTITIITIMTTGLFADYANFNKDCLMESKEMYKNITNASAEIKVEDKKTEKYKTHIKESLKSCYKLSTLCSPNEQKEVLKKSSCETIKSLI